MWYVEIEEQGRRWFRLRLPAAGLSFASSRTGDVQLEGLPETLRVEPARQALWLTREDGRFQELGADDEFRSGPYAFRACRDQATPSERRTAHRTKTLRYDAAAQALTVTGPVLRLVQGPDAPREIELEQDAVVLGTQAGCDVVLTDEFVSGRHARLSLGPSGWTVTDLGSRNGAFLDEVRVVEAAWAAGTTLRVGHTELQWANQEAIIQVTPAVRESYAGIVGRTPVMQRLFSLTEKVAPTEATVLIHGPTGSGKELFARALHQFSGRAGAPFIAVNCGSIVRELIASELFGHVKGAFTGAVGDSAGIFELAQGGTVFLDEVGELPLDLQPNLLRVLEEREVRRVGGNRVIPVDVRVVAATHRDLRAEVSAGRFREDLFYRLEMITMDLPPLRERLDDLPLLVTHLLEREGRRLRRKPPRLTAEALAVLRTHAWPGNVRELANVLARAMLLTDGREIIDAPDLSLPAAAIGGDESAATLEEAERALIRRTLAAVPTRKEAAARLGIALSTLYEKMRKYGIE